MIENHKVKNERYKDTKKRYNLPIHSPFHRLQTWGGNCRH